MEEQTGTRSLKAPVQDSWMDTTQLVCHLHRTHVTLPRLSLPLATAASALISTVCNLTEKHTLRSIVMQACHLLKLFVIINSLK